MTNRDINEIIPHLYIKKKADEFVLPSIHIFTFMF